MVTIKTDSRKIKPGDTFVALPGISSDGHDYIEKAIELGATKIVAEHGSYNVDTLLVKDTRKYLNELLYKEYGHILNEMKIIGVTGTNGKTTTCYLIYQILNKLDVPCAYIGTIGYYLDKKILSLPNTSVDIADLYELLVNAYDNGYKHVALEVSSQGLSLGRLETIPFDIAIFTNLTQDHLDFHNTMENYASAKQLLFKQLKDGGKAIVNHDDKYSDYYILEENNNITYGINGGDYKVDSYKMSNNKYVFNYFFKDNNYEVSSELIGKYNIYNILGSIAAIHELGINIDRINSVVPLLKSPNGRMDRIVYNDNNIIIDYAHTPDAICNIINTAKDVTKGNIYVVFGCTGDRDRTKRPIMTDLVLTNCKKAIITIDDLHNENPTQIVDDMLTNNKHSNYELCLDRGKAIQKGIDLLDKGDTLLILGKGHEEFIIMNNKRIPFNDKVEVINYINKQKIKTR